MQDEFNQDRGLESYNQPQTKHNALYATSLFIGLAMAVYIYLFNFDSYSETTLISITPLWFFPLVFGYYGFMAQWLQGKLKDSKHENVSELMLSVSQKLPVLIVRPLFNLFHMPLFLVNNNKPMVSALVGSAMWVLLLVVFFVLIFPAL